MDTHLPTTVCVAQGVLKQVHEKLLKTSFLALYEQGFRRQICVQL